MSKISAVLVVICSAVAAAQDNLPQPLQASPEHEFLKRFVGEWDCETKAFMQPGEPPLKMQSTITGRMIGDFWAIVVVKCDIAGRPYHGQGTFGYDSQNKKRYIGTWADSMSDFLWQYEGFVDGDKLVLNSEGPNPAEPDKMIKARDTWQFKGADLIVLTGEMEGPDGKMVTMMTATCKRKK